MIMVMNTYLLGLVVLSFQHIIVRVTRILVLFLRVLLFCITPNRTQSSHLSIQFQTITRGRCTCFTTASFLHQLDSHLIVCTQIFFGHISLIIQSPTTPSINTISKKSTNDDAPFLLILFRVRVMGSVESTTPPPAENGAESLPFQTASGKIRVRVGLLEAINRMITHCMNHRMQQHSIKN